MSFTSVYQIFTNYHRPTINEVDALAGQLKIELPVGYREYVTTLGDGELCDFLFVEMPEIIGNPSPHEKSARNCLPQLAQYVREGRWQPELLAADDLDASVVFARSAERPFYLSCPRFGSTLFELVDDAILEIPNGFFSLVDLCTKRMEHDFPFFVPYERRRQRGFDVRAGFGLQGFLNAVVRRWGGKELRRSRTRVDETHPNLFVQAIGGRFELFLDNREAQLPEGHFFVRATYDSDSEAEIAGFVESVLLPGGKSWVE